MFPLAVHSEFRRCLCLVLAGVLIMSGPFAGAGQIADRPDTSGADSSSPKDCFTGRPSPECRSFMITEVWLGWRLDSVQEDRFGSPLLNTRSISVELGWMANRGSRDAVGASLSLTGTGESRLGVNGRYRRWLSPYVALDAVPGVWVSGKSVDAIDFESVGFTARTGLMYRDLVGVSVGIDAGPAVPGSRDVEWRAGARLGSYAATVGLGLGILVFIVYAGALAAAYGGT